MPFYTTTLDNLRNTTGARNDLDLARKLGLSKSTISVIKSGRKPSSEVILAAYELCGIEPSLVRSWIALDEQEQQEK